MVFSLPLSLIELPKTANTTLHGFCIECLLGDEDFTLIHSDEGRTLETSLLESFTAANSANRPCS